MAAVEPGMKAAVRLLVIGHQLERIPRISDKAVILGKILSRKWAGAIKL